jgi:tetratricopeptide (TPR) repeat protein
MKKKILFIIFVLLICAGLGFYFYKKLAPKTQDGVNVGQSDSSSSQVAGNTVNIGGVTIQGEGDMKGVKIEPIAITNNKPAANIPLPDLNKEIKITTDMSEDAKKIVTTKIQDLSSQLKKDSDNLENWLVLGVYRKTIGDYESAKEVWEYASAIRPQNSISFNNLGELYAYYLKDNKKAEENYTKAIENDPSAIYIYRNFFDFYRYFAKDMAKARAILEKGIATNPATSSDLKSLLQNVQPATSDLPR